MSSFRSLDLQVHNTFGERHVYVLPVGPEYQDADALSGFTHSWTFARQFHVSPFNDRSGLYTCSIVPPPHHPTSVTPEFGSQQTSPSLEPSVRIDLHTSDPRTKRPLANGGGKEASTMKLLAVLRPMDRRPFTSVHLLYVLAKYPITLFLSFPLIAYEAARLHYLKGLDVYVRPAPRAADLYVEKNLSTPSNPVQQNEKATLEGGGVGWQPEGTLERYTRRVVVEFLRVRAEALAMQIKLVFADPNFKTLAFTFPCSSSTSEKNATLSIFVRSPQAFLFLFIAPTPRHALALGQDSERQFSVSDEQLFMRVFEARELSSPASFLSKLAQRIRLSAAPKRLFPSKTTVPQVHFSDLPRGSNKSIGTGRELANVIILVLFCSLLYIEKYIFTIFRAKFVPGTEPWKIWTRAEQLVSS